MGCESIESEVFRTYGGQEKMTAMENRKLSCEVKYENVMIREGLLD